MTKKNSPQADHQPHRDCDLCPRLVGYRIANRTDEPNWHNAPVPSFGPITASLLIVGLAPGRGGANRTGRPFTGDAAGDLLYATLLKSGFATGTYASRPDDGIILTDTRITNAVRCVPPENKPTPEETRQCSPFLKNEISAMPNLRNLVALGKIAHDAVIRNFGLKIAMFPFAHGAVHCLSERLTLTDSFHCSRYNTNTGKLTVEMFDAVFASIKKTN